MTRAKKFYLEAVIVLATLIASTLSCAQENSKSNTEISHATKAIMKDYEEAATSDIRKLCAAEWPENFSMQKHCVEKQTKARDKAQKINVMASPITTKIWANCTSEWTDKRSDLTNWVMMYHCFEKQMSAYRSLNP